MVKTCHKCKDVIFIEEKSICFNCSNKEKKKLIEDFIKSIDWYSPSELKKYWEERKDES